MIEYARKTGKSCGYCHIKIGGGGNLTQAGARFRENGYVLRETRHTFLNWKSGVLILITIAVFGSGVFIHVIRRRSTKNI